MLGSRLFFPIPKFLSVCRANLLCCFHGLPFDMTRPLLTAPSRMSNKARQRKEAKNDTFNTSALLSSAHGKEETSCNRKPTFVSQDLHKKWNDRTISKVFSFLHQGLLHAFVAVKDHYPQTKCTDAENVSILFCKLDKEWTSYWWCYKIRMSSSHWLAP